MATKKTQESLKEFKKLMAEGKKFGRVIGHQSEEEIAMEITRQRRKREYWRQNLRKTNDN